MKTINLEIAIDDQGADLLRRFGPEGRMTFEHLKKLGDWPPCDLVPKSISALEVAGFVRIDVLGQTVNLTGVGCLVIAKLIEGSP